MSKNKQILEIGFVVEIKEKKKNQQSKMNL